MAVKAFSARSRPTPGAESAIRCDCVIWRRFGEAKIAAGPERPRTQGCKGSQARPAATPSRETAINGTVILFGCGT